MFADLVKTVKVQLYERVSSPLVGAFIISWCLWNYKFLLVIIDETKIENKLFIIDSILYPTWLAYGYWNFLGPLATALLMIYLYPIPARKVFEHSRKQQLELKKIQQNIENDTPMTLEEGRAIRQEALKLEIEFHSQLKKKDEEINDLKNIVGQITESNMKSPVQLADVDTKIVAEDANSFASKSTVMETKIPVDDGLSTATKDTSNIATDTRKVSMTKNNNELLNPEMEILVPSSRDLFFGEFWKLDDISINEEAKLLISQVSNNQINDASDLLLILQRLFFFSKEKIINVPPEELKTKFQAALSNQPSEGLLDFKKFNVVSSPQSLNDPDNQEYRDVKAQLYNLQEQAYQKYRLKDVLETFDLLDEEPNDFFAKIYKNQQYDTVPIFALCNIDALADSLYNATPDTILKMVEFFRNRYRAVNIRDFLSQDGQSLLKLQATIKKRLDENILVGSKRYSMKNLLEALEGITQRLRNDDPEGGGSENQKT